MLTRRVVSIAISVALVSLLPGPLEAGPKKRTNIIKVLEATYGGNCPGVQKGNATQFVAAACADNDLCNYRVYYKQLGGDPAPDCQKDFKVTYTCGRSVKPDTCQVPAEAGKGGEDGNPNRFCLLHCLSTSEPAAPGKKAVTQAPPAKPQENPAFAAPSQAPVSPGGRPVYRASPEPRPNGAGPFSGFWR